MISATGSAINARTFNNNTKDPNRDEWTGGAMQHLVDALKGAPVAIVLDKQTGFTEVNVTLGGVRPGGSGSHAHVLVQRVHSDGTTGGCWYPLFQVGTVIELGDSRARWTAIDTHREEQTRAIRKLQEHLMAELGIDDRYKLPRGKWECTSFPGYVHASFDPEERGGSVRYTWKRYSSADLVAAK